MYKYDEIDKTLVNERVVNFSEQVSRRINNQISEDDFKILRLQNGLYMQRHAYMLRIAIPYGVLSSKQLRVLSEIAEKYDRGYGHFTTRQNLQLNWINLEDSPAILAKLAQINMHAIQTSGNCVRNITTDAFTGVAKDEIVDTRAYCEWLRQWSTMHPEFLYLPRKFKIAINGAMEDRAVVAAHDIGIKLTKNSNDEVVAKLWVGGGMGRTPIIGSIIKTDIAWQNLPDYITAVLRVYNLHGRRDNIFKARIKILVKALGISEFSRQVEEEFALITKQGGVAKTFNDKEWQRINAHFQTKQYENLQDLNPEEYNSLALEQKADFAKWRERNTKAHKRAGYINVVLSLKPHKGLPPGDITCEQMFKVADLASKYCAGEMRITHEQNIVFVDVRQDKLFELWQAVISSNLATANIGLLTDIIACPGGDFCALANARSIPVSKAIQEKFDDLDYLLDIGEISVNISGCINSCGHHHVANIGILGIDKDNQEFYQITIGGSQGNQTNIGKIIGRAFSADDVPSIIEIIIKHYLKNRINNNGLNEKFITTLHRIGVQSFKEAIYG